jgi:Lon protease-like protein
MIGRALQNDRTFGVAQMVEGQEGEGERGPQSWNNRRDFGSRAFADGRMNVQTIGGRRFQILSVREEDEVLMAQCQWLEDDEPQDGLVRLSMHTRRSLSRYFDALALNTDAAFEGQDLDVPQDPQALSMFIAAILQLPIQQNKNC